MYIAKVKNAQGDILTLTDDESKFQLYDITGLSEPKAALNWMNVATLDGAVLNSARLEKRNLVLYIRINGNVEANRHLLYSMFRTKEKVTFYYSNKTVDVCIDGYVESVDCPLFTNNEVMQISILCPDPYFKALDSTIVALSDSVGSFSFPFAINKNDPVAVSEFVANRTATIVNASQAYLGMIITINVHDDAPDGFVTDIKITDQTTGEYFLLDGAYYESDAKIIICTIPGKKSVKSHIDGSVYNELSNVNPASTFLQLPVGESVFSYSAADGAADQYIDVTFEFTYQYRGV